MSYNPDLNNQRFFDYVHELVKQVQELTPKFLIQCLSVPESTTSFMFRIDNEDIYYPVYLHVGMESTAQETLYEIRKRLEDTIELYSRTKSVLQFMQQAYPELKEPTVMTSYVDERTKSWVHTPAFMFSVINKYHNEVSFILTQDKLLAYTTTTLENRGEVDIMYSESTILNQDIHQPSDIKDLAINVLMKDATYQFRKHFGIEGVDY
jgi:hypothetical protein